MWPGGLKALSYHSLEVRRERSRERVGSEEMGGTSSEEVMRRERSSG